ncbi:dihydrolipoyl dehydrogenase family protein [Oleidesulfovibrio sp.]|uniref:dihydrolipoyl dehydrogenase family protein n=1 Tax=Oleidesulfovibrio sp. TaxID=2909707 RepID=UPI003A840B68
MTHEQYDLVVLGAGPGGSRAALLAAQAGMTTALVEQDDLGGTCLNWGCIPTKMLLGATASKPLLDIQRKQKSATGEINFSLNALQQKKDRFIKGSRQALGKQLKQAGITVLTGTGSLAGPHELEVATAEGSQSVTFKKLIIATGSTPASFPGLQADGDCVLDSSHILSLTEAPESLIIVGGGAIGLEIGDLFSRFGTQITIVEALPHLAPSEDADIGEALQKALKREGWTIHTGKRVSSLVTESGNAKLTFEDGTEITAAKALMAAGRVPASTTLQLDKAGVQITSRGWIVTDNQLRAAGNIFAIGDVNGRTLLAHAAGHQARYVVSVISGKYEEDYLPPAMPSCVYGHMEVMRAGATAKELLESGLDVFVSRAALIANPIAQSYGTTQGFVKAVWIKKEESFELRGMAATGHGVSHLIGAATIMVEQRWQQKNIHDIIYAHPTLDEALEAALSAPLEAL